MAPSPLADLLRAVAAKVWPDRPADTEERLHFILEDNGLGGDAPPWFLDFWNAMLTRRRTGRVPFDREEMRNVDNTLAELGALLPLGYEDYGEGITFDVEPLGVRAFISREGRGGAYTYEVEPA